MWESITKPTEIEKRLLARNKRHLQQTYIEGGASAEAPMSDFLSNPGIGEASKALLSGKGDMGGAGGTSRARHLASSPSNLI